MIEYFFQNSGLLCPLYQLVSDHIASFGYHLISLRQYIDRHIFAHRVFYPNFIDFRLQTLAHFFYFLADTLIILGIIFFWHIKLLILSLKRLILRMSL